MPKKGSPIPGASHLPEAGSKEIPSWCDTQIHRWGCVVVLQFPTHGIEPESSTFQTNKTTGGWVWGGYYL